MIYIILEENNTEKRYKIGITKRRSSDRLKEIQTGNSNYLEVIFTYETKWSSKIERIIHSNYKNNRINGEWFSLTEDDLINIKRLMIKLDSDLTLLESNNTYIQEKLNKKEWQV